MTFVTETKADIARCVATVVVNVVCVSDVTIMLMFGPDLVECLFACFVCLFVLDFHVFLNDYKGFDVHMPNVKYVY